MAGYQRHKFDTTYVQSNSGGGWGDLARGFSNRYSIGGAIASAVNKYNVSKANTDYNNAIDNARQQTLNTEATQQAINADNVLGGLQGASPTDGKQAATSAEQEKAATQPQRALKMTEAQLAKLSPEGRKYFEDYYARQEAIGNKPEYRYDRTTRAAMEQDAAQKRDRAVKDSYLFWEGDEAYKDYRNEQMDLENKEAIQGIQNMYKRPDWYSQEGVMDRLNNLSTYMGSMLGQNYGTFSVKDGKLYNDTGKGLVEVKPDGLSMLKHLTMTDEIWDKTGSSDGFKNALGVLATSEGMGLARDELKLRGIKAAGSGSSSPNVMKHSDMVKFLELGYKLQRDNSGVEYFVSPDGQTIIPTGKTYSVKPTSTQKNHNKQAIPTSDKK